MNAKTIYKRGEVAEVNLLLPRIENEKFLIIYSHHGSGLEPLR